MPLDSLALLDKAAQVFSPHLQASMFGYSMISVILWSLTVSRLAAKWQHSRNTKAKCYSFCLMGKLEMKLIAQDLILKMLCSFKTVQSVLKCWMDAF